MPSFQKRRLDDGRTSVVALVRIKGFKPVSKAFREMKDAKVWAKATETELRRLRDRGGQRDDTSRLTIRTLCESYLNDPETLALNSYETTEQRISWWVNEYGDERVMGFGIAKIREARDRLLPDRDEQGHALPGRSPSTVNRYLSTMRTCWNWGRHAGLIANESSWPSKVMLTEPDARCRFLDESELKALRDALAEEPPWFNVATLVSIGTGIRQGELLRLRWRDVDLKTARIMVGVVDQSTGRVKTKNATRRSVYLPKACVKALRSIRGKHAPDDRVFPISKSQLEQTWTELRRRIDLTDFRWHDLRHTCGSYLAQGGASLLEIGSVLGHKSPTATMRYAHLVQGAPLPAHSKLEGKLKR